MTQSMPKSLIRLPLHLLLNFCLLTQPARAFWRDQHQPTVLGNNGIDPPPLAMEVPSPLRYRGGGVSGHFMGFEAYRLHCHSCMSPYLEDQFQYISHLYRRPMVFTEKCDHGQFDGRYVRAKNCTDACVTLRMNDRVGGRRRFGFMRGCLSDIIHHNRTAVRFGELSRTTKSGASICTAIRLRDLFVSSDRYGFDPHDHVDLCACIRPNCNDASKGTSPNKVTLGFALAMLALLSSMLRPQFFDGRAGNGEVNAVKTFASARQNLRFPAKIVDRRKRQTNMETLQDWEKKRKNSGDEVWRKRRRKRLPMGQRSSTERHRQGQMMAEGV